MPPFVCISCIHTLIIAICPARVKRKSPKRRLRRIKRGDFEEVPRLSAASAGESRPARRCARIAEAPPAADKARRFRGSAPVGRHDGGQTWAPPYKTCVGRKSRRAGPVCPAARKRHIGGPTPLQALSVTFGDCSPRGRAKSGTPAKKGRGTWRFRAPWGALSLNIPGPSVPAGSGAGRRPRRAPSAAEATGPAGRWSPD